MSAPDLCDGCMAMRVWCVCAPAPAAPPCRCGHTGGDPHPCHARAYTCRRPATRRFYAPRWVALAGAQTKAEVSETWACDACWSEYQKTVTEKTT